MKKFLVIIILLTATSATQNFCIVISRFHGKYNVNRDASGFGSGVFFYRLAYGNYVVETRKMVLLK